MLIDTRSLSFLTMLQTPDVALWCSKRATPSVGRWASMASVLAGESARVGGLVFVQGFLRVPDCPPQAEVARSRPFHAGLGQKAYAHLEALSRLLRRRQSWALGLLHLSPRLCTA